MELKLYRVGMHREWRTEDEIFVGTSTTDAISKAKEKFHYRVEFWTFSATEVNFEGFTITVSVNP